MTTKKFKSLQEPDPHLNLRIPVKLGDLECIFSELNNTQRMALVKSIIWTSENMHLTHRLVVGMLGTDKFLETLD